MEARHIPQRTADGFKSVVDHRPFIAGERLQQFDLTATGRGKRFPQRRLVPLCCVGPDAPVRRHVVERIAEKRHVAGLPRGHRDRRLDGKRLDRRRICLFDEASQLGVPITHQLLDGRFQLVSRVRCLFSREAQPFPTGRKPPHHIGFAVVGNRMTFVAVRSVGCGLAQIDKLDRARKQGNTRARRAPNRER